MHHFVSDFFSGHQIHKDELRPKRSEAVARDQLVRQRDLRLCTVVDEGLAFVLREPGALRIALDRVEVLALLGISDIEYSSLCGGGQLGFSLIGRDYFEPLMKFHTFWDLQRYNLGFTLEMCGSIEEAYLDDFLDETALVLDTDSSSEEKLTKIWFEASAFAGKLQGLTCSSRTDVTSARRKEISIFMINKDAFTSYGNYCIRRLRNIARQGSASVSIFRGNSTPEIRTI